MNARRNNTTIYAIVIVVIIVVFLVFSRGQWMNRMIDGGRSMAMVHWNWFLILICIGIGFLLGWFIYKRKR